MGTNLSQIQSFLLNFDPIETVKHVHRVHMVDAYTLLIIRILSLQCITTWFRTETWLVLVRKFSHCSRNVYECKTTSHDVCNERLIDTCMGNRISRSIIDQRRKQQQNKAKL